MIFTSEAGKTTKSHPPLQRGKLRLSPRQGRGACALLAQRARKSLHSPLSKGRKLHAPGWGPFLVSPSSTCIKYFKSHSRHVCHFAEPIYARLLSNCCCCIVLALAFCYVCEHGNIFYSLCLCNEERTFHARLRQVASSPTCRYLPQLTNKRFDPTYLPSVHSLVACSAFLLSSPCALRL
ncbi:hypothetical protein T08_15727 [Trichinella sp. T8]|nr:hypothetical protein T08_15727 [Trichinella sp. T8]